MSYRGRLAPSPSGLLHLGHARTFFVAYERARAAGGTLVLRNEDLDPQRSRSQFTSAMMEDLRWLGMAWQEGPDVGGAFGPYVQSARRAHYEAAWRALLAGGHVYRCTCSRRELAESASAPHEGEGDDNEAGEPIYSGRCRPALEKEPRASTIASGPAGTTWRFRVPDGEHVRFADRHLGAQSFTAGVDFGDFPIWRRDDVPAYQLACVVDDAAMRITEVVRGRDLLLSTARQLLLYRALGLAAPGFFHCPLVRDADGHRLAKRNDALSIRALRERGHTPAEVLAVAAPW